jgi:general secretion pathway protein G
MRRLKKVGRAKGFTLMEVMLVIAILALLVAFVVPSYLNVAQDARIKNTQNTVMALSRVIQMYYLNVGAFPKELKDLVEKPGDEAVAAKWQGPYLENPDMLKDSWGQDLKYKCPGEYNAQSYDLWSVGPDGQDGNEDDVTNWKKEK